MNRQEIYLRTAKRIIAQLEAGTIPWQMPWKDPSNAAYNATTGKVYSYFNSLLLGAPGGYCTFKQSLELGKGIEKGAKAITIYQGREIMKKKVNGEEPEPEETEEEQQEQEEKNKRFIYCPVCVFPLSVVRELDESKVQRPEGYQEAPSGNADEKTLEAIYTASILKDFYLMKNGINFCGNGDAARYNFELDEITLPDASRFISAEEYYSTFFHEATHSTGINKRLNRGIEGRQTESSQAMEEVIAELGSAFICANLGLDFSNIIQNQAAYINGWIQRLTEEPGLIFRTAAKAAKAADFIFNMK